MRKLLFSAVSAVSLMTATPQHADSAMPVNDAAALAQRAATEVRDSYDQALKWAQMLKDYALEMEKFANMVTNTMALPMQTVQQVTSVYNRAQSIAMTADYVVSGSGSMMTRARMLSNIGRNAANMPGGTAATMEQIRRAWADQLEDNAKMAGLQSEWQQLNDEFVGVAQTNSATAIGRQAATQAAAQNVAAVASQIQGTNARLDTMIQGEAVKDAMRQAEDDLRRQTHADAMEEMRTMANNPGTPSTTLFGIGN